MARSARPALDDLAEPDALDLQVDCKPYRAQMPTADTRTLRATAAGLFLVTAALFAIGVNRERATHHAEAAPTSSVAAVAAAETGGESGAETAGETASTASASGSEATETTASSGSETSEKVLGLNLESTGTVIVAVITSLAISVGLLLRRSSVARAAVAVGFMFAVVDVAEIAHQHDVGRTALAVLAGVVAVGHVLAGTLSGWSLRSASTIKAATF